ncbi:class I SAM-dependent methyltransferase [Actinomyces capricornis]|uniref:Methyltransferase domain-containing protein n=1 Tax=Actinomyces capricornis TaxID=2755559 RepID=A0ABM7U8S8_9ACTO|nr:class I SAM-dependent methyltransferase [Actinomyces capricornis]BDA63834.1 hypothetical protein MANAM107_06680 [Actinomyces capricornis]
MPPASGLLRGAYGPGAPDYDPRIVDLYDQDNPDGPDHDYYRALADRVDARDILDLGCGTGILTVTLAAPGRRVVGADPSTAMLDHARRRPGAAAVTWVEGDSRALACGRHERFDLMILTGNAAQHIPDPEWQRTLHDLRHSCRDGAVLAFETRNPAARAWIGWAGPSPDVGAPPMASSPSGSRSPSSMRAGSCCAAARASRAVASAWTTTSC